MKKEKYNIAIVGAGGLVGRTMARVLEEREFPVDNLVLLATERSAGKEVEFNGKIYTIQAINKESFNNIDIALFSAGKSASIEYAPIAAKSGCVVIDNGSYWRMNEDVPLVVPEVNPEDLSSHHGIIANPNCSTIQLLVALKPLMANYGIKRVVCSTYQSISGAGQKGVDKLFNETYKEEFISTDVHPIAFNLMFHSISNDSGYSEEEIKMVNETRKMLHAPNLPLTFTCVRVPTLGGHGESVNIELSMPYEMSDVRKLFKNSPGLIYIDNPQQEDYPTPSLSKDTDPVYIGRIRRDDSVENGLNIWVVADNLRKGAATNAVQIAEYIVKNDLLEFENKF